jgi:hypothetical protein
VEAKTVALSIEAFDHPPAAVAERKLMPGFLCVYLTNTIKISKIPRDFINRRGRINPYLLLNEPNDSWPVALRTWPAVSLLLESDITPTLKI